ncbi:putative dienelactone hydrolase [Variovorax sp. TBS-050B]|uniref:alpha/beta hydrolase family protein n=1 Tax=Variovorax sp. TBS-050B TaxID=2940551 RepID=UPI002472F5D1|nr:dienelactone hydrolase [Variovorax sp. TBS-050B]MDH6592149.1 putative dienelactone hydrolase [Variovorax sp. TBS-050B]
MRVCLFFGWLALLIAGPAGAAMGLTQLPGVAGDGPVTLFYPSDAAAEPVRRGPFTLQAAPQAAPVRGNGRLVVVSHGSGGAPWVHADLARELVAAGFVVAMPEHRADNQRDGSNPGPDSWTLRPAEVSRAIDAVAGDARFAPLLALDRVGMYGMSAGGHTALSLAGGRWSPAGFMRHCEAHLVEDFQSCVGLITRLTGSWLDPIRQWAALFVIRRRFGDDTPRAHHDPRIAAVVAGVPSAADFDMASLATPRVPLALITAPADRWLIPRFHSDRVLAACLPRCELLAEMPAAGHGALLSPPPPGLTGLVGELLDDPPGFDRHTVLPDVNRKTTAFFRMHLRP